MLEQIPVESTVKAGSIGKKKPQFQLYMSGGCSKDVYSPYYV